MSDEGEKSEKKTFKEWADSLKPNELTLWREAMAQLRHLNTDFWNTVRFFLTVNGIIVAASFSILARGGTDWYLDSTVATALLALIGLCLTVITGKILAKARQYYVEMLLRKTLLEDRLGFYKVDLEHVNLSFPWKVPEKDLEKMKKNTTEWKRKHMWRKKTIARSLCSIYYVLIVVYSLLLIVASVTFGLNKCGWTGAAMGAVIALGAGGCAMFMLHKEMKT